MNKYDELVNLLQDLGVLFQEDRWAIEIQNLIDKHTADDCEDVWFDKIKSVDRDERADFERWHAGKWPSGAPYQGRWEAWQARAALDKSTEGAGHD